LGKVYRISKISKWQSCSYKDKTRKWFSIANSIVQMAVLENMSRSQDSVIDMCDEFKGCREFIVEVQIALKRSNVTVQVVHLCFHQHCILFR